MKYIATLQRHRGSNSYDVGEVEIYKLVFKTKTSSEQVMFSYFDIRIKEKKKLFKKEKFFRFTLKLTSDSLYTGYPSYVYSFDYPDYESAKVLNDYLSEKFTDDNTEIIDVSNIT